MNSGAERLFTDLPAWQSMLDRHREVFAGMLCGARIGILPRSATGIQPGKRLAGLASAQFDLPGGKMLAWEAGDDGFRAEFSPCASFKDARADLLLVADDMALDAIHQTIGGDTLSTIKKMIRSGNILFFVMKTKYQLQDAGYEDFLDTLGLAFLGACR